MKPLIQQLLPLEISLKSYLRPRLWWIVLLVGCLTLIRLVHLSADTPQGVAPETGLYLDEGAKTLGPRNLALVGQVRWHPEDDYKGWMRQSPLTQFPYYLSFLLFGARVESARIVTIGWFCLFLCSYTLGVRKEYPAKVYYLGLLLLALHSPIFFFSRVALFEMALITVTYSLIFLLRRCSDRSPELKILVAVVFMVAATLLIKGSAVLYLLPVVVATVLASGLLEVVKEKGIFSPALYLLGAPVLLIGYPLWELALARVEFSPARLTHYLFFYPPVSTDPFVILIGIISLTLIIIQRPISALFKDSYVLSLVAIVTLVPVFLAPISYHPFRYYLPIIPAYILLGLEWCAFYRLGGVSRRLSTGQAAAAVLCTGLALFYCMDFLNRKVLVVSFANLGSDPGISTLMMKLVFIPAGIGLGLLVLRYRFFFFSRTTATSVLSILLLLTAVQDGWMLTNFFLKPHFEARRVADSIERKLPSEATLIGDWAPFLTLGTQRKVLYMNRIINRPARILELKPDYFLYCESFDSRETFRQLNEMQNISFGSPIFLGSYKASKILAYPLKYGNS